MIEIRKAVKEDITNIVPLWVKLMDMHKQYDASFNIVSGGSAIYAAELEKWINNTNYRVLVAINENVLIGYITGWVSDMPPVFEMKKRGYINDIWVEDGYKSKGIGKKLADAMQLFFKEKKTDMITLNAAISNSKGVKFWQEQGFNALTYYMVQHLN